MLNNLHAIHSERGDTTKLAQVGARLQALGQSVPG
jgi:hypothetical protein